MEMNQVNFYIYNNDEVAYCPVMKQLLCLVTNTIIHQWQAEKTITVLMKFLMVYLKQKFDALFADLFI